MRLPTFVRVYGRITLIVAVYFAFGLLALTLLSSPSIRERRQTANAVKRLVTETQINRKLACLAMVGTDIWADREVRQICRDVGVLPGPQKAPVPSPGPSTPGTAPEPSPSPSAPGTVARSPIPSPTASRIVSPSPICLPVICLGPPGLSATFHTEKGHTTWLAKHKEG